VTLGLWVFPLLLLAGGVWVIVAGTRKKTPVLPPAADAAKDAEDPFLAQVRADLDK
jgi:cytochrome c-type biogenesis protein CcmH/NrfF